MRFIRRSVLSLGHLIVVLFLTSMFHGKPAQAQHTCSTSAAVWKCWERTLNVTPGAGIDPFRTLKLKVTFTKQGQSNLSTYIFWDGGTIYKFRTAFPDSGTWSWTVACEAGCTGTTFSPTSGTVSVATHSDTNPLYQHGFLKVYDNQADPTLTRRYLVHADGTPFFWIGDTAWAGPLLSTGSEWTDYLNNRALRKFSVIQTALPVDAAPEPPAPPPNCGVIPRDAANQRPFNPISGCTSGTGTPNACSQLNPPFWRNFEEKVQEANDKGFVVAIVGLMERVVEGCNGNQPYPSIADSRIYARHVVARLAGNHVIFSPAFDRAPDIDPNSPNCTAASPTEMSCRMRLVGEEIKSTSSRHLVTNHWAGSLEESAMRPFQGQSWLDFQMFQSGQAKSELPDCVTQLQRITQRAREIPYALKDEVPTKPNVNGESLYDGISATCSMGSLNYTAYRARQTGYLSLLSGATGYTYGVQGVWDWGIWASDYSTGMQRPSNFQMEYLGNVFRGRAHKLIPEHDRIQNQATDAQEHLKMVVARNSNGTFLMAYLPNDPGIKIRFANLPNVPRNGRWFNPRLGTFSTTAAIGVLDPADSLSFTYARPACPAADSACPNEPDWVLILGGVATPADFDGDRVSDTVIYRGGAWLDFDPPGSGVWTGAPSPDCIPAPADYDGDGNVDLSLKCGGAWHFFNDDGTYLKGIWTGEVAGDLPVPADYDGDGKAEVVVFRAGAWLFYDYATGASTRAVWTGSGSAGAIPVPMDYDGDGRTDFSIYQNGTWHFFNADGTYRKGIFTGAVAGDIHVPGDYNGDGQEEPVIFRGGAWQFYDFATGAYTGGVFTGDGQPAPLDYDGDGTMDFTVYADGAWHFFRDDGSYLRGVWYGNVAGDKPISRRQLIE